MPTGIAFLVRLIIGYMEGAGDEEELKTKTVPKHAEAKGEGGKHRPAQIYTMFPESGGSAPHDFGQRGAGKIKPFDSASAKCPSCPSSLKA